MALVQRLINVQFNLGTNPQTGNQMAFNEGGTQVVLQGLRVSAHISKAGGLSMGTAEIAIYGMTPSLMNQLSTLGLNPRIIGPNFVTLLAGDATGMSLIF